VFIAVPNRRFALFVRSHFQMAGKTKSRAEGHAIRENQGKRRRQKLNWRNKKTRYRASRSINVLKVKNADIQTQ
jgi:hypothetical protein